MSIEDGRAAVITARERGGFSPAAVAEEFPILSRQVRGKRLVYLDNAATTQKPRRVIEALIGYYQRYNANVHRGIHTLAEEATAAYERARDAVARFLGGLPREEVIFTRGTTESINLVARSWARNELKPGDRILLTRMEHHANLVPWLMVAKWTGAEIRYIPLDGEGRLDLSRLDVLLTPRTKLVALTQMSNVLGTINPVEEIARAAKRRGAVVLVDGAQGAPHMPVDLMSLGVDFYAFSGHKMLGPTGIGVLWGRAGLLEKMEPFNAGGEMIGEVTFESATWAELPHKFEGGTPNIAGAIGLEAAIEYLEALGMEAVRRHEVELTRLALDTLLALGFVTIYGPKDVRSRGGAVSFTVDGVHPHDLATILDTRGVAIRAGHHCAQPLHDLLGVNATARASFYLYNTREDVEAFAGALRDAKEMFHRE